MAGCKAEEDEVDAEGEARLVVLPVRLSSQRRAGGSKDISRGPPVALGIPLLMTWGMARIGLLRPPMLGLASVNCLTSQTPSFQEHKKVARTRAR